jgi:hypothetical protein
MILRPTVLLSLASLVWLGRSRAGRRDRSPGLYVAGTAGRIDLYARLLGRHLGRHIPGKPSVTVQVMRAPAASRGNYLAQQAPRDGTAITAFANGLILSR